VLLACALAPRYPAHIMYHLSFFGMGICLFLYSVQKLSLKEMLILIALFSFEAFILFDWTYWVVGACTLLSIVFIKKVPKQLLFLGTISYSLYLVHPPIITRVISLSEKFLPQLGRFWSVILCLVVAIASSYVFYLLVEKPFFKLSKKIDTKASQSQLTATNAETAANKI
jgi:peptidoglycan/LPS O-acetylase OafA/YrhL